MQDAEQLELNLQAKSKAPRVTLDDVKANIVSEFYFTAGDGMAGAHGPMNRPARHGPFDSLNRLTFCVIVLKNGFTVTGQSACVSAANFDEKIGKDIAYKNAFDQLWQLMGYELAERLRREREILSSSQVDRQEGFSSYIGTKLVNAIPMSRLSYNALRGWTLPADENGEDEGYLVEYTDKFHNPPHVPGFQGYVSWSPKDVFENAYKKV